MSDRIYLSKDGKSFGPFSAAQIEEFRRSGEINQYAWMCSDPKAGWVPVAAPPPPPPAVEPEMNLKSDLDGPNAPASPLPSRPAQYAPSAPTPTQEQGTVAVRKPQGNAAPTSPTHINTSSILAIGHDSRTVVSGSLIEVSAAGATLSKAHPTASMPIFRKGTKILLNLLDNSSGRSENIRTVVSGAVKRDGEWEYRLRWESLPEILRS